MHTLKVEGMDCSNCAAAIAKFLEDKGLQEVFVDFAGGEVRYLPDDSKLNEEGVKDGIHRLGYTVVEPGVVLSWWTLERKLTLAAIFTVPLFLGHMLDSVGIPMSWMHDYWVQLTFCLPVYAIGFWFFGRSALQSVRNGLPNMDVLIFLGSTAAFVYSCIGMWLRDHDYMFFETCATIITLVLLGNWLERRAVAQTTSAIDELANLQVAEVQKITFSGEVKRVPLEAIMLGDVLQVNEGDLVPADGIIMEGNADLNESMLTGESLPVSRGKGDKVIGGSLLISGNLQIGVTAIGAKSLLQQTIALVKDAQREKPPIQRLADKISAIFVPAVVTIAALVCLVSHLYFGLSAGESVMRAIAVLVISCPCAMGLATPTAVMVGVGRMAREGILIRGGNTLEQLASVRRFIFDKTGTLTTGKFKIGDIHFYGIEPDVAHHVMWQLEQRSSHPVARAVVTHIVKLPMLSHPLTDIQETKGVGMSGIGPDGERYQFGSPRLIMDMPGIPRHDLYLLRNGGVVAGLDISDTVRPEAPALIERLKKAGANPIMLSGDRAEKADKAAIELGFTDWKSEQLPAEKLAFIAEQTAKQPTAMVGDGINDAPALTRATVGISVSEGSAAAIKSANVVLLKPDLNGILRAKSISIATLQTIRQNLFWAFAYNIVAIPVAASGLLNPAWGALFMALSDVVVIGNSLRLRFRKV